MTFRVVDQKRRLFFFVVCAMLACSLLFGAGIHAVVAATGAFLIAVIIVIFRPAQRHLVECIGVAMLVASALPLPQLVFPAVASAIAIGLERLIYGPFGRLLPVRLGLSARCTLLMDGTRQEAWAALVPGASHPEDFWSGRLLDFDSDPIDPETLYLKFLARDRRVKQMTLSFLEREPPSHARFLLESADPHGDDDAEMLIRITKPDDGVCLIESRLSSLGMPVGAALARWFDNDFGDELVGYVKSRRPGKSWSLLRDPGGEARTANG